MNPKRKQLAVLGIAAAILMTSLSAHAAGPTLVITDSGYQIMSVGADGKAVLTDVGQVVDLRGNAPPPGDTPPPPDTADPIAAKVKSWAAEVGDPTSAQALAVAYREVGKVSASQPRDKVLQALRLASDTVLNSTQGTEKWKGWRSRVSGLIDAEEAKGPINWTQFCESVAKGLESSAPSPALDPALLTLIINAVLEIIRLIFSLPGGGGV